VKSQAQAGFHPVQPLSVILVEQGLSLDKMASGRSMGRTASTVGMMEGAFCIQNGIIAVGEQLASGQP